VLDRILHPVARRRRTAAHRRVLHRQRHTGLVTGVPRGRFELTDYNRRVLGLHRGPPGPRRDEAGAADPDRFLGEPAAAMDEGDEPVDAISPALDNVEEGDGPIEP